MKLEIKLDDPTSCVGCPCLYEDSLNCNQKFVNKINVKVDNQDLIYCCVRPKECIEKNGE